MRYRFLSIAVLAFMMLAGGAFVLPAPAFALDAAPTVREIVDRHVEAIGGAERFMQLESMTMSGTFSIPGQGIEARLHVWTQAPDRLTTEVEIPGLGKMRNGYDGAVAWSIDPMMGAQVLADASLAQMREQANFFSSLYRPEDYTALTLEGLVDFEGTPCYEVVVTSESGLESRHFFAVDTGLLAGMKQTAHSPMGEMPSTTVIKEYRDVDGIKVAVLTEQSAMGMKQVIAFESVSFEPIEASVFALPAEIAALLDEE